MLFTKMHGLGNDFIIVADQSTIHDDAAKRAIAICDRHFGVGADGLVYILPSCFADLQMRIFNADGSEPEQCGNAIRCVGKYVYDKKLTSKTTITVETRTGIQTLDLEVSEGYVHAVRVD